MRQFVIAAVLLLQSSIASAQAPADLSPAGAEPEATAPVSTSTEPNAVTPGVRVQLELVDALRSDTATIGQSVAIRLAEPITIDGQVVVPAGAPGVAEVIDAHPNGMQGMPGTLVVSGRYLEFNGQRIPLEGMILAGSGQNRAGTSSVGVGLVGPLAVFVRGAEVEAPAGTILTGRVAGGEPEVAPALAGANAVPAPAQGKGQIVVFRPYQVMGWPYTYGIAEDGHAVVQLRNSQYAVYDVQPGVHGYTIIGLGSTPNLYRLEITAGQRLFIRHGVSILTPSDEATFQNGRLRLAEPIAQN